MLTDAQLHVDTATTDLAPSALQSPVTLRDKHPLREKPQIEEEIIIEEVSIDGMCGVY